MSKDKRMQEVIANIESKSPEEVVDSLQQDSSYEMSMYEEPLHISEDKADEFIDNFDKNFANYNDMYDGDPTVPGLWSELINKYAQHMAPADKHQFVNVLDKPYRTIDSILHNKELRLTNGAIIALQNAYPSIVAQLQEGMQGNIEEFEHDKYLKLKKLLTQGG